MCEILIENPDSTDIESLYEKAKRMYRHNPHGLGIVAVYKKGNTFDYRKIKSDEVKGKKSSAVRRFLWNHSGCWRYVIHVRYETQGKVCARNAHPLWVDCPKCQIDMVMHNGWVSNYDTLLPSMKAKGHEKHTTVDSELIAHAHSEIPDSIDRISGHGRLSGQLDYVLFGDSKILVHNSGRYNLSDNMRMCKNYRVRDIEGSAKWLIAKPDEIDTKEVKGNSLTYGRNPKGSFQSLGKQTDRDTKWVYQTGDGWVEKPQEETDRVQCPSCDSKHTYVTEILGVKHRKCGRCRYTVQLETPEE